MWVMLPIVGGAAIAKKITTTSANANSNARARFNFEDDFEEEVE